MRLFPVIAALALFLAHPFAATNGGDELVSIIAWEFEGNADDRDRYHPGQSTDLEYGAGHIGKAGVFNGRTSVCQYASQSMWTFSRHDSFTLDFWLKTTQKPAAIATLIMARNPGGRPNWSFVLGGQDGGYGRRPGHISLEMWTWDTQRLSSHHPVNDGAWHHVQGYFDKDTSTAVLVVDDAIQGAMNVPVNYTGGPARLVFGDNVGDHQPYAGLLDSIRLFKGVPARIAAFTKVEGTTQRLDRAQVEAGYDAWLARLTKPRPIAARNAAEWQKRRAEVRAAVLADLGLTPFPYTKEKPGDLLPLDVQWGGKKEYDGFTAQAMAWQTWKGVYAKGFLYVPKGAGPFPTILNPHGHFALTIAAPEVQRRCIALAQQGYICLSVQSTHPEDFAWGITPMTGMLWDNMRALDYLCTRPDVDQTRIGCTGCSGGGEQTVYLMCTDDRIDAAVPAVYASYSKEIMPSRRWTHCNCNWVPGLLAATDEPEMAAMFAPKPVLYISNAQDWTAHWQTEGMPDVLRVYGWQNAAKRVENVNVDAPHGYPKPWRELMYGFFNRQFTKSVSPEFSEPDALPEITPAEMEAMLPRVPTCEARVQALAEEFAVRLGRPPADPSDRNQAERIQYNLRERLRGLLHEPIPTRSAPSPTTLMDDHSGDYRLRLVHVKTEPEITVPALLLSPLNAQGGLPLVVVVDDRGKEVVFAEEEALWRGLLARGAGVLIPDLRYWGELSTGAAWHVAFGNFVGRPDAAVATHDVLELVRSLRGTGEFDRRRVVVVGIGEGATIALLAGALDGDIAGVAGTDVGAGYREGRLAPICPGILTAGDLPELASLIAPRPLLLTGVSDERAYAGANRYAQVLRSRSQVVTKEREGRDRPGLLVWYGKLGEAR